MKRIIILLTAFLAITACSDDDFGGDGTLGSVDFLTQLKYDTTTYGETAVNEATVTLTNVETGDVYTGTSDDTGVVFSESILPGTYNISATKTLTAAEFETLFGYEPTSETVIFNGSQEQVLVNENVTSTEIELKTARIGGLVIKQIYYGGSSIKQGASLRDQFVEIYNNSNEIIYADGLYLAQTYGKSNTNTETYTLNSGQYDWTQSIGMSNANANTNYVYCDYVVQIPGSGKDYPINPGESIIIAETAINHKEPLLDNDGDPITIEDPSLTVDLSIANFEGYLGDWRVSIGSVPYQWDIQNPAVTDLLVGYWGNANKYNGNKDFFIDTLGRDSFIIFRTDDLNTYTDYPAPDKVEIVTGKTKYFLQIPNSEIIDGVELQYYNINKPRPKHLVSEIDASSISTYGRYDSKSVIRKTKNTVDGRIILEDTNNSAEDFVVLEMANPKGFVE